MPRMLVGKVVGPQGPKGEQGIQGDAGIQGPQGPKGEQGQNGKDGLTVSVNGVVHDESGDITLTPENIGAASAEQLKVLSADVEENERQIDELSIDRGYKDSNLVTDMNQAKQNMILKTGANTIGAPTIEQYAGIASAWDGNFGLRLLASISGKFFVDKFDGDWKEIITTDKSKADLILLGNWSVGTGGSGAYVVKSGNTVEVTIQALQTTPTNEYNLICILPDGYRPSSIKNISIHKSAGGEVLSGYITQDGRVYTYVPLEAGTSYIIGKTFII